jgi:hypothetical protein
MTKQTIITVFLALGLSFTSVNAYDLKTNMLLLNAEFSEVQQGFMSSNEEGVSDAIRRFAKDAQDLLGNKAKFADMLPEKKKHKAAEAVKAAQIIATNTQIIIDEIDNKYKHSEQSRRENAQRAFGYIQNACFRCHNAVRDIN